MQSARVFCPGNVRVSASPVPRLNTIRTFAGPAPSSRGPGEQEKPSSSNCGSNQVAAGDLQLKPVEFFRKGLPFPQRVLPAEGTSRPTTVYTLRMATGKGRGAGLGPESCPVNVCLVGKDGTAFLHSVSPINDPAQAALDIQRICQAVGEEAGANCALAVAAATRASSRAPKERFQDGAVDEVSFLGPELGPLGGLMIGPETGAWHIDEVHVSSSRTRHTDRFVCRDVVGKRSRGTSGDMAAFLKPVPQEAVVYGSGDTAIALTKEQAAALASLGMAEYSELKLRLLASTAALCLGGTALSFVAGGAEAAQPFAAGSLAGLVYQWLLQVGVDSVGTSGGLGRMGPAQALKSALGNPAIRLLFLAMLFAQAASSLHTDGNLASTEEMRTMFIALAGFLTYKVAVLTVGATSTASQEPSTLLEKNSNI